LRHREPQVGRNLKAKVARAGGDFGSLIQHALKAYSEDSSDPLAALADREIREGSIGHGMFHRVEIPPAEEISAHPGVMYAVGEKKGAEIWRVVLPLSTRQSVVQMQKHLPGAAAIDMYSLRKISQFASDVPAILPSGY
jgi:hypothetical protein